MAAWLLNVSSVRPARNRAWLPVRWESPSGRSLAESGTSSLERPLGHPPPWRPSHVCLLLTPGSAAHEAWPLTSDSSSYLK